MPGRARRQGWDAKNAAIHGIVTGVEFALAGERRRNRKGPAEMTFAAKDHAAVSETQDPHVLPSRQVPGHVTA